MSITPPPQSYQGEVPASIALVFNASVASQYGTDLLGITDYSWNFGDGSDIVHSATSTVPYSFAQAGVYSVMLIVHAPFTGNSGGTVSIPITVYEGTHLLHVAW